MCAARKGSSARTSPSASARPDRPSLGRVETAAALVFTALALGLHYLCLLRAGPLWRDEANIAALAALPLRQFRPLLEFDSFPPLFPVLLHLLGPAASDFRLRLAGFLIGILLLGSFWLNRRLLGLPPAFAALAFFALNPVALCWGDSVRAYGLGSLLIVLSFGLYWRLSRKPSAGSFAAAALAGGLAVQSVYQCVLLLAAIAAAAVFVSWRRGRARAAAACAGAFGVAALSLAPYIEIVRRYQEHSVVLQRRTGLPEIWQTFQKALDPSESGGYALAFWCLFLAAAVVGAARGLSRPAAPEDGAASQREDLARYALAASAASVLIYVGFLLRLSYPMESWYFILPLALAAVALETALTAFPAGEPARVLRLAAAAALVALSFPTTLALVSRRRTTVDAVAAYLTANAGRDDLILVNQWVYGVSFDRYYAGPTPWTTVPPLDDHRIHRHDLLKRVMMQTDPMGPLRERMAGILRSGGRVWLVGGLPPLKKGELPPSLPPAPDVPTGWWNGNYVVAWGQQLVYELRVHNVQASEISLPIRGEVNPLENVRVWKLSGWREE